MGKVTTINGSLVDESEVKVINGKYVLIQDIVVIDRREYYKGDPKIYFNALHQEYKVKTGNEVKGIYGYDNNKLQCLYGIFEKNSDCLMIIDYNGNSNTGLALTYVADKCVFDSIPKIFDRCMDYYVVKNHKICGHISIRNQKSIGGAQFQYTFPRYYSASKIMDTFTDPCIERYDKCECIKDEDVNAFSDYSFGLEFETAMGNINEISCFKHGLIPLKDGSISGNEFASIPMKGRSGFALLYNQLKELRLKTTFDKECSLHLHLGGYPINKDKIFALYKLLYILEPCIKEFFPAYSFHTSRYKSSGKDYCKELPFINSFEDLYMTLTNGNLPFTGSLTKNNPLDRNDDQKWQIENRYWWVNFNNLCFKPNAKTVEFRLHGATFNIEKIINWMFICSGILKYADKQSDKLLQISHNSISKLNLDNVLYFIYPNDIYEQLVRYISGRIEYLNNNKKFGDLYGYYDMLEDDTQSYGTNLIYNFF